jgi:hypothetical protein
MAVKAINDIVGPNRLVPTLLAFSTFPKLSQFDTPILLLAARALTI